MDFNKEKFKMVLHHIINKCGFKNTVGRTVLHKLLYFSDFNFYQLYNQSITNESYRKMERGPVPIHFEEAIEELVEEGKISLGKRRLPCGKIMNRYFSLTDSSPDLTNDELRVINKVIKDLSYMNGKQIIFLFFLEYFQFSYCNIFFIEYNQFSYLIDSLILLIYLIYNLN